MSHTNTSIPERKFSYGIRRTLIAIVIGAVIVTAVYLALFAMEQHNEEKNFKSWFVLYVAPFAYAGWIIYAIVKVINKAPVLRLDERGVWWKAEVAAEEYFVPWEDVVRFEPNKLRYMNKAIRVFVKDPKRYLSDKFSLRKGQEVRIKKTGTHIVIPINFIDHSPEELIAILNNYRDMAQGKPGAKILPAME